MICSKLILSIAYCCVEVRDSSILLYFSVNYPIRATNYPIGSVSISTIARCLEGCLITVKKLELLPSVRNSPANKECRRTHALWLQEQHEIGARFCYVDECGFGLYTARNRGRSMQGLPARRVADNQRTPHVTLICAICPGVGLVHSKILLGGAKQTHFDQFISELFHLSFGLALEPSSSVDTAFIVLDNAPCHRGIENRLEASIPSHIELKRLPPYSCELNPLPKSKILYKTNSQCSRTNYTN